MVTGVHHRGSEHGKLTRELMIDYPLYTARNLFFFASPIVPSDAKGDEALIQVSLHQGTIKGGSRLYSYSSTILALFTPGTRKSFFMTSSDTIWSTLNTMS